MRLASLLSACLLALPAQAQTLRIADPVVSVDGRRTTAVGAPLTQPAFDVLALQAPGVGTFEVSARPFAGARPAGQFDGDGLYFAGGGRTVRLRSAGPILDGGQRLAYVRFAPSAAGARGPVRLSATGGPTVSAGPGASPSHTATARRPERRPAVAVPPARSTAETARLRAETARLRAELDRLMADRRRLADERARLASSLQSRDAEAIQATAERERRLSREVQNATELARRLTQQRDALAAERDRLLAERNTLIAQRTVAETEREREAAAFRALQARLADVDARRGPSPSGSELRTLRAQADLLRAQLVERDRTIEALRAERDGRTGRAAGVSASLAEVQAALDAARAERDGALADARTARSQRDDAVRARAEADAARLALEAELVLANAARTAATDERDRLRTQLAARQEVLPADVVALQARLATEAGALAAARAELDREQRVLRAERAALSAIPSSDGTGRAPDVDLAAREAELDRRQALVEEQEAMQGDRARLAQELAAARAEIAELRAALARAGGAPTQPAPRTPPSGVGTPMTTLPGFDFSRLANPDVVRRRLDEVRYPRWAEIGRIEGDVLVLFQTDRDGTVVRTAVPTPLGGGLDAVAEELVRQMRFAPPTVSGQPTGLRSQVTVRFALQ